MRYTRRTQQLGLVSLLGPEDRRHLGADAVGHAQELPHQLVYPLALDWLDGQLSPLGVGQELGIGQSALERGSQCLHPFGGDSRGDQERPRKLVGYERGQAD